jgi:hypothetical protein
LFPVREFRRNGQARLVPHPHTGDPLVPALDDLARP